MNRRVFVTLAIAMFSMGMGGCAAGGPGVASGGDRELLTMEDLAPYEAMDAYSVIRRLRGHWYQTRSTGTMMDPNLGDQNQAAIKVYIDGVLRVEGVEILRGYSCAEIREMRHLDGRDATMQYGTGHGAGAILVVTGR
ncbi:hypothetical protein ACFL0I_02345 [Gemmatimonadota bacterium]